MPRWFTEHPASVGESYAEHWRVATRFGARLAWGGVRCMVHGVLPFLWKTAGSDTVRALHAELVAKRAARAELMTVDYVI